MYNNHLKKKKILKKLLLEKKINLSSNEIDRLMLSLDMLNYAKQYTKIHNNFNKHK